jgi:DNA polymerase-1
MENRGLQVSVKVLLELKQQFERLLQEAQQVIYQAAGHVFNIQSPKQLAVVLYDELHLGKELNHKNSTKEEILELLSASHPIIPAILQYRKCAKLLSTYLDGIYSRLDSSDVIHTNYTQYITNTGRLSSIDPNLQNIPARSEFGREVKKIFVARPGCLLVSFDYSQIELRLLAHLANVKGLIEAFNLDQDIHYTTAQKIFGTATPSSEQRTQAKTVNFGIIYGQQAFSLAKQLGISFKEANAFIQKYDETYPEIKEYVNQIMKQVASDQYVSTIFGHRRDFVFGEGSQKALQIRQAVNAPIQGSSADLIKVALIQVDKYLTKNQLESQLLLTIHDEIILEVPLNELDQIAQAIPQIMNHVVNLVVPLKVSMNQGTDWFEVK